jgi:hypothetical protein
MEKALAPEISTWPDANPQLIGCECGAELHELTMMPFTTYDEGNEIVTFAFQPV